jgi:hypothetical protein
MGFQIFPPRKVPERPLLPAAAVAAAADLCSPRGAAAAIEGGRGAYCSTIPNDFPLLVVDDCFTNINMS